MIPTTRAFIAAQLPPEVKARVSEELARLKKLVPSGVKWVDPGTAHLTLAFLGSVPDPRIPAIAGVLDAACAESPVMQLATGGLGSFPPARKPRVLWLGLDGDTDALSMTADRLWDALEAEGFTRERRAFKPHVTLGRARGKGVIRLPEDALEETSAEGAAFQVSELVLFGSELTPSGPIHTPLHRAGLGGGQG